MVVERMTLRNSTQHTRLLTRARASVSSKSTRLRLFIIEAPSPMDLLKSQAEAPALEKACALIGHEVCSNIARSKAELRTICKFISSIDTRHYPAGQQRIPLCVHIAAHGNERELGFGKDSVSWEDLLEIVQPLCRMPHYYGDVILIISACEASHQKLTKHFAKKARHDQNFQPPLYMFITADDAPTFADALVSWIVFYHQLPRASVTNKSEIKAVLARVKAAGATTLMYHRWDKSKKIYLRHRPAM